MAWYLNNTRIFVQEHKKVGTQIIPRLQPLTGGTVHQFFGYESPIVKLAALVVGNTDKDALEDMYQSTSSVVLSGPYDIYKSYYMHSIETGIEPATCQTIRTDLAEDAPVYTILMELYEV
jgi:hypothetical protein